MSILSNLWGGIKNIFSSIGNSIDQSASAAQAVAQSGPNMSYYTPPVDPLANFRQNQSFIPNMSTPYGQGAVNNQGQTVVYNSNGSQNVFGTVAANSGSIDTGGNIRPSTYVPTSSPSPVSAPWAPPVDQYGRASSRSEGTPFMDANGNYIVPKVGFSGLSGEGGGGFSLSVPQTGTQGVSGTDFARGFGGAGQGTASALYNQEPSDEQKRQQQSKQDTTTISQAPVKPTPSEQAAKMVQDTTPHLVGNQPAAPQLPAMGNIIDAEYIQKASDAVNKLTSYQGADRSQLISSLLNDLGTAYNQLTVQNQNTPTQVEDTPAQLAWYKDSATPELALQKQQAVDAWTAQNTNLNQSIAERSLIKQKVQATDEVFTNQINAIKDNPNLPKALARKQVQDLLAVNERVSKADLARIKSLDDEISTQQRVVDQAFQLKQDKESDYKYAIQQQQQTLDRYLNNPARISLLNPADLKALSQMSGISVSKLKGEAEKALTTKQELDHYTEDRTGDLVYIDHNTGKELYRIKGASYPQKAPGSQPTERDINNDVAGAVMDFQKQMKEKQWAGANPDAYEYYRATLQNKYGASAALQLDKAMQDAGIIVDYANK